MNNQKIGESLANKAPWAVLFTTFILAVVLAVDAAPVYSNILNAIGFGCASAALLLCYWHGKGGSFFILGLLMPLFLIVQSELPSFLALLLVVSGFFAGFALLLSAYRFIWLRK